MWLFYEHAEPTCGCARARAQVLTCFNSADKGLIPVRVQGALLSHS